MKFTEEQYFKIIKAYDDRWGYMGGIQAVIDYVEDLNSRDYEEALLLAIPKSREWAHDKFVEKEPEFHFILKNTHDSECWRYHLARNGRGAIILFPWSEENDDKPVLKESEIIKWGFNPEMFDREEV